MIFSLRGTVTFLFEQDLVIEVQGIGYGVKIGKNHATALRTDHEILLFVFHHQTEHETTLFGFPEMDHRTVFKLLLEVPGIGPRTALGIIDAVTPQSVLDAVLTNNQVFFTAFSGIGPKMAKKILFDLENKVGQVTLASSENTAQKEQASLFMTASDLKKDLISALLNLGYAKFDAIQAVSKIFDPEKTFEENLKNTLKTLKKPVRDKSSGR